MVKSFGVPVVRINACCPDSTVDALIKVCRFAVDYWKTFNKDILIDMVGFRLHGHNEVDEPRFTQPEMYKKVEELGGLADNYAKKLVSDGVVTQEQVDALVKEINAHFEAEF